MATDNAAHNSDDATNQQEQQEQQWQLTPNSVDADLVNGPLLNVVLMEKLPQKEQIAEILRNSCGHRLGEIQDNPSGGVTCEIDGNHLISIMLTDTPPQDPENMYRLHPIQTGDRSVVDDVQAQMMVALLPNEECLELEKKFRQPRMAACVLHSQLTAALATLEGAKAVHSTATDVTFAAQFFHEAVNNNEYVMSLCSAWVMIEDSQGSADTGDSGDSGDSETASGSVANACTMGLLSLGHPEITVEKSTMDPTELYHLVLSVANYIIHGETMQPGDTLGLAEGGPSISIVEGSHPAGDDTPALRLEISES